MPVTVPRLRRSEGVGQPVPVLHCEIRSILVEEDPRLDESKAQRFIDEFPNCCQVILVKDSFKPDDHEAHGGTCHVCVLFCG